MPRSRRAVPARPPLRLLHGSAAEGAPQAPAAAAVNALVLQGGGALGSYQAGAFEALAARAQELHWVAGISIGAINAALIAGNPAPLRAQRLREFWERVSLAVPLLPDPPDLPQPMRGWWDGSMALWGMWSGVSGFFAPRPWWNWWPQHPASWYDTAPLRGTLLELVDFELLNDGPMRFSVGAVDVQSGNFEYFDNRRQRIGPEHIMASGALPPGFAPVPIDGRWYWDGGLVSNTPLAYVLSRLQADPDTPVTIFQIDLFSARGQVPHTLQEAVERDKDIRYSSRTRLVSDLMRERHHWHLRLRRLAELLPPEQRASAEVQELLAGTRDPAMTLVHVILSGKERSAHFKDYEFSRLSMNERWQAGQSDMRAALQLLDEQPPPRPGRLRVLDHQAGARAVRDDPPPLAQPADGAAAPDDQKR